MMFFGWLLVFLGLGALAVHLGWIPEHWRGMGESHNKTAREILDERYAKGEISREEYTNMREDLEH